MNDLLVAQSLVRDAFFKVFGTVPNVALDNKKSRLIINDEWAMSQKGKKWKLIFKSPRPDGLNGGRSHDYTEIEPLSLHETIKKMLINYSKNRINQWYAQEVSM